MGPFPWYALPLWTHRVQSMSSCLPLPQTWRQNMRRFSPLTLSSFSKSWSPHLMRRWMKWERLTWCVYLSKTFSCSWLVWLRISPMLLSTLPQVLRLRVSRKAHLDLSGVLPNFLESTAHIRRDPNWRVRPVPPRLQRRHVDIGDLAPCDTERFIKGLQSPAQGIQVLLSITFDHLRNPNTILAGKTHGLWPWVLLITGFYTVSLFVVTGKKFSTVFFKCV